MVMALIGPWIRLKGRVQVVVRCVFYIVRISNSKNREHFGNGIFFGVFCCASRLSLFLHLKVLPTLSWHSLYDLRPIFCQISSF